MSQSTLTGLGGGKPKLITQITSGTGTYVPTVDNARCLVRVQGGGGGGATSAAAFGGGGGAFIEATLLVPIAGLAYTVGAGGAAGAAGSASSVGKIHAGGGGNGTAGGAPGLGAVIGLVYGPVSASAVTTTVSNNLTGVSGGGGGTGSASGGRMGFPAPGNGTSWAVSPASTVVQTNGVGNNSGGDSFYGTGGASGSSPAAGNYGAGGGYNAAGLGGYIEIWDFGA